MVRGSAFQSPSPYPEGMSMQTKGLVISVFPNVPVGKNNPPQLFRQLKTILEKAYFYYCKLFFFTALPPRKICSSGPFYS
jgi:hypothetical protein